MSLLFSEYVKENWSIHKLPEIVWFQEGPGVRKHQYRNAGVKLLNVANLQEGKVDLTTSDRYISEEEAYGKYKHFLVDDGDLIIASSGIKVEYFEKKMGFVNSEHLPLCMNTSTIRFKSKNDKHLHIRYLMHYLKTNYFKLQIGRLITGSAQLNFGPSHLKKIQIPLPPLSEQKRIVAILDKAQQLIDLRRQQLTKLDELIQSIFYDMFGDPVINSKKLPTITLGEACNLKAGKFIKASQIINSSNDAQYPCFGGNGLRGFVNQYSHDGSYPLIGRQGALCGNVQFAQNKFYVTEHAIVCNPIIDLNTFWLYFTLREMNLNRLATGAAQPGINVSTLNPLNIIYPQLKMQNQFTAKVQKIEEQKNIIQQSLAKLEENFKALQQRAFRGHL